MTEVDTASIEERLDRIIALLKLLAHPEIEKIRRVILSTPKKQQIFELCDGTNEMSEIATKANVSGEYVRLTIRDLENSGIVTIKTEGTRRYPKKVF
jgi:DNA-binding transcriptional ArsR family regulator